MVFVNDLIDLESDGLIDNSDNNKEIIKFNVNRKYEKWINRKWYCSSGYHYYVVDKNKYKDICCKNKYRINKYKWFVV